MGQCVSLFWAYLSMRWQERRSLSTTKDVKIFLALAVASFLELSFFIYHSQRIWTCLNASERVWLTNTCQKATCLVPNTFLLDLAKVGPKRLMVTYTWSLKTIDFTCAVFHPPLTTIMNMSERDWLTNTFQKATCLVPNTFLLDLTKVSPKRLMVTYTWSLQFMDFTCAVFYLPLTTYMNVSEHVSACLVDQHLLQSHLPSA